MKPDELWLAQDGNFTQVLRKGPAARFASYAIGVIELLIGPALMITLGVVGAFELPSLIGGVAIIVVVGGMGLATIVPAFETTHRGSDGAIERLGKSFPVIVDPSDGAYMIVR